MSEQTLAPNEADWQDLAIQAQAGEIHEQLMPHINRLLAENGVEPIDSSLPGAELINGSIENASSVADRVQEVTGTEDIGEINQALSFVAEATEQHGENKAERPLLDALIVGAEEDPKVPHNPLDAIVRDGIIPQKKLTHAVATLAHSGAQDVAENIAIRIDTHKEATEAASIREYLGIPSEVGNIKSVGLPDKETFNKVQLKQGENWKDPQRAWQERVFGKVDLAELRQDALTHLELPASERRGEAILINGLEKRPVMDIGLDESAIDEVRAELQERSKGMSNVLEKLQGLQLAGTTLANDELRTLLYDNAVWSRGQGNFFGSGAEKDNTGGVVADLYIDNNDLRQYEQLDQLIQQVTDYPPSASSKEQLANRLLQLAVNSFPSGVELMHSIRQDTLPDILDHGALATRSQRKHGQYTENNSLNGAFIHMTGPGSIAPEYGDALVAGIPIDTIVRHSPYMHLEDTYTDNKTTDGGSMQYHMQPMTLNNIETAPLAFRAALVSMQERIGGGLQAVNIGSGNYDNWSFSAGDKADTAGQYSYPLAEISLYATPSALGPLAKNASSEQKKLFADRATILAPNDWDGKDFLSLQEDGPNLIGGMNALLLNAAQPPHLFLEGNGGVVLYAPTSSKKVSFSESTANNNQNLKNIAFNLENIKPDTVPRYIDGLVAAGMPPVDAFEVALESVNTKNGSAGEMVISYVGGRPTLLEAGISPMQLVDGLSDEIIRSEGSQLISLIANLRDESLRADSKYMDAHYRAEYETWQYKGQFASAEVKSGLINELANRLSAVDPDAFALNASRWEQQGYTLSDKQRAAMLAAREHDARQEFEIPKIDVNF